MESNYTSITSAGYRVLFKDFGRHQSGDHPENNLAKIWQHFTNERRIFFKKILLYSWLNL
jgi:hypothetical protein